VQPDPSDAQLHGRDTGTAGFVGHQHWHPSLTTLLLQLATNYLKIERAVA
jgi:hypothetical protein